MLKTLQFGKKLAKVCASLFGNNIVAVANLSHWLWRQAKEGDRYNKIDSYNNLQYVAAALRSNVRIKLTTRFRADTTSLRRASPLARISMRNSSTRTTISLPSSTSGAGGPPSTSPRNSPARASTPQSSGTSTTSQAASVSTREPSSSIAAVVSEVGLFAPVLEQRSHSF